MDFELNEEQQAIFDMARDFGAEKIAPFAAKWEKDEAIPRGVLEEAAALGLAAIYVPEEDGGSGLTRLDATLVFEALSMACPSVASFLSIHNMCTWMVSSYGSDEMKARLGSGAVLLIADAGGKAAVAAGVTPDLTDRVSAVDLVKAAVPHLGGKGGGGRPDMAQGGGKDVENAGAAIEAAEQILAG